LTNLTINDVTVKSAPASNDFVALWDVAAAQQKKASVDSLINPGSIFHPGFRPALWYMPHYLNDASATTGSLSANTVVITPFFVPTKGSFDTMGINVTTASSSGSARIGIYELLSNFSFGKILAQCEVATNTTGLKSAAISLAKPSQGWYFLVVNASQVCTVTAFPNSQRGFLFGSGSPPSSFITYFTATLTYGAYVDSPAFSLSQSITNAVPAIWLKAI
jgi:hypothetical protein